MTTKKKSPFKLPTGKAKGPLVPIYSFNSVTTAASDRRVIENTPCLKKLYEFLARPIP